MAIYRSRGRLPRLKRISLLFECMPQSGEPVGDEVEPVGTEASADNSSFYGDEYDTVLSLLVKIAVDGNLAVSIFDTISNTAAGPLERFSLRVNVLTPASQASSA